MAFHVACPITCRKICFCSLGFPRDNQVKFQNEIHSLQDFLQDNCLSNSKYGTVQIHVPKPGPPHIDDVDEVAVTSFGKCTVVLKKIVEDVRVDSDSSDLEDFVNGEDYVVDHSGNVTCHMCYMVEIGRSERAVKMVSCKCCGKKYHRNCLKPWAQHRDLFDWSSWACPFCRTCEGCGTLGDPKKLMFCKRCDDAYHCDCQQPKHKNVSSGPFLCSKHTKCYSCASKVPGNGQSLRWFLGHTCCDACGRLFVKGNYCPVCLKVYRDSESTPMVCCDFCQRWVHCMCDGISDAKYMQFQADGNLQYKCSTCRGECYQVKDLEDAVQEIWKRKDIEDKELMASLRTSKRVIRPNVDAHLINKRKSVERKAAEKVMVNGEDEKPLRVLRIKSSKPQDSTELNPVKAKKLVISIGPRKAGVTNPTSNDVSKLASKTNGKHGKLQSEETVSRGEVAISKGEGEVLRRHSEANDSPNELQKDSRRLLKLKIKKHNPKSQDSESLSIVEERSRSGKGHRSKRKRKSSSPQAEKSVFNEDEDVLLSREDSLLDEMLDASLILKKLGKDAKGKKVQIHNASDNSWEKGVVSEVGGGGTSKLMVTLENGKVKTVELGKQGVRFVRHKQKRTRT